MYQKIKAELMKTLNLMNSDAEKELKVSEMTVGSKVEVINADGTLEVAPDGEYTIGEDMIVVKDGLIESINGDKGEPKEEMEEEAPVDENAAMKAELDAMKEAVELLKEEIEKLKASVDETSTSEEMMAKEFSTQLNTLNETIKVLIDTPAEFSKTNESVKVKDSKDEKMMAAAKLFASLKKSK